MDDHRISNLQELQERLASGEYTVDPHVLADAIVRRRWSIAVPPPLAELASVSSPQRTGARVRRVARTPKFTGTGALAA
ncbi:MAG TPA: hypothetical protein VMP89_11080 [Solirubrobacteraceae bacterium]|nr:hypothetical protein [Solirubrobacteraceae bacterium]